MRAKDVEKGLKALEAGRSERDIFCSIGIFEDVEELINNWEGKS